MQDGRQARRRQLRVQRDVGGPGLQDAVESHRRFQALGQVDAHAVARTNALRAQDGSQLAGALGEGGVGQRRPGIPKRLAVGVPSGRLIDDMGEEETHGYRPSRRAMMLRWMSDVPE